MKKMLFSVVAFAAATAFAAGEKIMDICPEATSEMAPTGVEWENANDAKLAEATSDAVLAGFVADEAAAKALLASVKGAYLTDSLVARQIAAVSQWVMLPDAWYCLFWDGEHAAGRKVWVKALVETAEATTDSYVREFCLDQIRWCGCPCPCLVKRIRAIGAKGDKAVADFAEFVVRELEKKSVGLPGAVDAGAASVKTAGVPAYAETIDEGFVPLFNGKDLTGWFGSSSYGVETIERKLNNGTVVRDNVIACFPERRKKGETGNLATEKQYENFILRFEFMMPANGNNGLGIRVPNERVDAAYYGMCELQLLDDGGSSYYNASNKADRLAPYQYTGSIYGIVPSRRDNFGKQVGKRENTYFTGGGSYVRKPGEWNFEEVKVIGSEIEVYLNGHLITKGDVSKFKGDGDTPDKKKHPGLHNKKGHITWCGHGCNVKWKNIRIKELPSSAKMSDGLPNMREVCPAGFTAYFDGCPCQLKTMWKGVTTDEKFDNPAVRQAATPAKRAEMQKKADAQRDAHWSVRSGNLFFDGFKGGYSLATVKDLKDFEIWADWRIMSIQGDSGLYLRGAPQVQVWDAHNQWGIGSGGLYNNQKNPDKALKVADRQVGDWNRFHVIMKGEKVTVWLNGVLVVDNVTLENYWDRAKAIFPVEQLELQCHGDPIEWRNIFIKEL